MNIDWTKCQTIRRAYEVENWHDGVFYMPQDPTVDFHPLYKLAAEKLGSFENAQGVIKDNLFWVENEEMNSLVQEAFDELPLQVVLNALIYDGLESVSQITQWRIK